jgi:uncharacterized protein YheU (UPF0270 family)
MVSLKAQVEEVRARVVVQGLVLLWSDAHLHVNHRIFTGVIVS